MKRPSLGLASAAELITMGDHPRAAAQLEGAVAMHNVLQREEVAYLADEVGLGKTYVALATLALFRHYDPTFRVLVIAPKENIQRKWQKDWHAFVRHNMKVPDLRVRSLTGAPARRVRHVENLRALTSEATLAPDQDIFARLTSFSHPLAREEEETRDRARRVLPWLKARDFPRGEQHLRDFLAQAYNAALPSYDLVIIDEAHNLKHGLRIEDGRLRGGSNRNDVLAQVLGHPEITPFARFEDSYRPIAERVLLVSATPVEDSFKAMWNQVHLVGKHAPAGRPDFSDLVSKDEDVAKRCAHRLMVRRINAMTVSGEELTKNLYRRTWHQGGISTHDEPLAAGDLRQRLTVALVQKQVSDIVSRKFNGSFQMGMLASFESFAQTALKDDEGAFDGDQAEEAEERIGIDTRAINTLARDHYRQFDRELAHPKMDALVDDLSDVWSRGGKALVFVRRVASVAEVRRKLDETHDLWLLDYMRDTFPQRTWSGIQRLWPAYAEERAAHGREGGEVQAGDEEAGGAETFFAWFFRGQGPDPKQVTARSGLVESGASLARKLRQESGAASTYFALPLLSMVLSCHPDAVLEALAGRLGRPEQEVREELARRASHYLPSSAGRRHRFDAVQAAGLELLDDPVVRALRSSLDLDPAPTPRSLVVDVDRELDTPTFFSRLHEWPEMRQELLPDSDQTLGDRARLTRQILLSTLIGSSVRLGRPLIDLYASVSRATGGQSLTESAVDASIDDFLSLLEGERARGISTGSWGELREIARDFDLLRVLNLPASEREDFSLAEAPVMCGTLLGAQQPAVGMAGSVNQTAVRQFRMPGYPRVLVCTDVLQEGEDLHTYCDRVIHYGVAWTPSAMEQRTGRIDRLNSLTERRFMQLDRQGHRVGETDKIQVQVPYLHDSIERVQALAVLRRMQKFTDLMRSGADDRRDERRINLGDAMIDVDEAPLFAQQPMRSAFDVQPRDVRGRARPVLVDESTTKDWWGRVVASFDGLLEDGSVASLDRDDDLLVVYGSRHIEQRVQPFTAQLVSVGTLPVVSIRSPVARKINLETEELEQELRGLLHRVTIVPTDSQDRQYDVSLEGDVVLADPEHDRDRVQWLLVLLTREADRIERTLTQHDLELDHVRATLTKDLAV